MSSHPTVEKTLELLDRLKSAVQEFTAREEKLGQEFRGKIARERQHREQTAEEQTVKLAAELDAADASFQAAKESAGAKYESRKSKISEARKASKVQSSERIETKTGHRKYELQKRLIQTNRNREAGLTAAATALEEFKVQLAQEQESLAALEKTSRGSFRGYRAFLRRLSRAQESAEADVTPDEYQLIANLRELLNETRRKLDRFRWLPLPLLFKFLPFWVLTVLCPLPLLLRHFSVISLSQPAAIEVAAASFAGVLALYIIGRFQAGTPAAAIANALGKARKLHHVCLEKSEMRYQQEIQRIESESESATQTIDQELKQALKADVAMKGSFREKVDDKTVRITARNEQVYRAKLEQLEREHADKLERLKQDGGTRAAELARASEEREAKLNDACQTQWRTLETEWKNSIAPIYAAINATNVLAGKSFPPWQPQVLEQWIAPVKFEHAAKFAQLEVDVEKLCETTPKDKRLVFPGPSRFSVALSLAYPDRGSILLETGNTGHDDAIGALNNVILRLLSTAPPGRLNFTVIDPVGLGQNFAGVMHLVGSSRVDLQACKLEYSIVSPK